MQDLTPAICKSITGTNPTGQLVDSRDDKVYWVTKLKDGNCWMTQNLDYDGGGTRYTTPNMPDGWPSSNDSAARYYDPGDYYYTNTSSWTTCANNSIGLSACLSNGWSTSGDSHYHIGNYYNWKSATNGTGDGLSTDGTNASGSICPSGWKLPTSKVTTGGSFGGLTDGLTQTTLRQAPYYFIPGGRVGSGTLNNAGSGGRYWSSTANASTNAYNLAFSSTGVGPSNNANRYNGQSVRCLVQGS